jgi:hypothetical protein
MAGGGSGAGRGRLTSGKERATFCEQKVAKKLCQFGPVGFSATGPTDKFAPLFSENLFP